MTLISPAEERKWRAIEREIGVRTERRRWGAAEVPAQTRAEEAPAKDAGTPAGRKRTRTRHPATCAACGQETTVNFRPRPDRPVYCQSCYRERKEPAA